MAQEIRKSFKCLNCGREFFKSPKISINQWAKRKLCSKNCCYSYKKRINELLLKCQCCGEIFRKSKYYKGKRKYCSYQCRNLDYKKRFNGKNGFFYGKKHSEEVKRRLKEVNLGKKLSKETIQKMKIARKKEWDEGKRKCIWEGKKGEKSHLWKGGKSFEPYSIDWTETLKRAIRERDKYICQLCNNYGNEVHHIDYNKKNCNPENLIILCHSCHLKTNFNRKHWENYFRFEIQTGTS